VKNFPPALFFCLNFDNIVLMKKNIFEKAKNIHFIGIGGIGISAVARMMLGEGKKVSGSDLVVSEITKSLEKAGAKIFIGHNKDNFAEKIDLVIYTVAISRKILNFRKPKGKK